LTTLLLLLLGLGTALQLVSGWWAFQGGPPDPPLGAEGAVGLRWEDEQKLREWAVRERHRRRSVMASTIGTLLLFAAAYGAATPPHWRPAVAGVVLVALSLAGVWAHSERQLTQLADRLARARTRF